jgi:hypothetical protein
MQPLVDTRGQGHKIRAAQLAHCIQRCLHPRVQWEAGLLEALSSGGKYEGAKGQKWLSDA